MFSKKDCQLRENKSGFDIFIFADGNRQVTFFDDNQEDEKDRIQYGNAVDLAKHFSGDDAVQYESSLQKNGDLGE